MEGAREDEVEEGGRVAGQAASPAHIEDDEHENCIWDGEMRDRDRKRGESSRVKRRRIEY
jgi:hypothetical protein